MFIKIYPLLYLKLRVALIFPDSAHVQDLGLDTADDTELWNYALNNDYVIASKDADFSDISAIHGHPPKVIWLKRGNCSTNTVEDILRNHHSDIETFAIDTNSGLIVLL